MNGLLVVNGYYNTQNLTALYAALQAGFAKKKLQLEIISGKEFTIALHKPKQTLTQFAVLWDKDILLARHLELSGVRVFNSSEAVRLCDDKLLTAQILAKNNLPIPKTIAAPFTFSNIGYGGDYGFISNELGCLGFPQVVKAAVGSLGEQVFICRSKAEAQQAVKRIHPTRALFQQFIDGEDIRVYVVGGQALGAMKRPPSCRGLPTGTSKVNNRLVTPARNAIYERYNARPDVLDIAVRAANALGCDFCGVDLMVTAGKVYILEVNSNAFFNNFTAATGVDPAEHIAELVHKSLYER